MNILFVANHYIERGKPTQGFTAYLYKVTQALLSMGHSPIIIAGGSRDRHIVRDGIELYEVAIIDIYIGDGPYEQIKNNLRMSYIMNKNIRKVCKNRKIDIIQFTSLGQVSFFYFGRIPSVLRLSSYTKIAYETDQTMSGKTIRMFALAELFSARRCNAVFAPSNVTAAAFEKDLGRRVAVIESPFLNEVKEFDKSIYESFLKGKKYALFFGRLYVEKGILVIADIAYDFLKNHNNYFMVFCGKDEVIKSRNARNILRNAAKEYSDRLIFLDAISHEKLFPVICGADFVILPSLMENFSNACVEAMFLKKVVIGTEGASFEQLIQDRKSGLLCQRNDSESLLDKMEIAVGLEEEEKKSIEYEAYRRIQYLRPELTVTKLLSFYEYVIDGCKRRKRLWSR